MKTAETTLSEKRINRLRAQGFTSETKKELTGMAFGIRFAYRSCITLLSIALLTQSLALFSVMFVIAFLGIILPKHPFDYLYNHALSGRMNKPKVPARSAQLKFACTIATTWIAAVIYLMATGSTTAGTLLTINLILVALLPATIDYCVPSAIYNALFMRKKQKQNTRVSNI
jgi:hypothetical protein